MNTRIIVIIVVIALAALILWQIIKNLRRIKASDAPVVSTPVTTTTPVIVITPPVSNIGKPIHSKFDNVNVWKGGGPVVYKVVNKDEFIGTLKKEDSQWYYSIGTTGEEIFVTKVNSYLK